jgi:hypothetical protein
MYHQLLMERAISRHLARQFDWKKSFLLAENAGILIRQHLASYWFMKTSIFGLEGRTSILAGVRPRRSQTTVRVAIKGSC